MSEPRVLPIATTRRESIAALLNWSDNLLEWENYPRFGKKLKKKQLAMKSIGVVKNSFYLSGATTQADRVFCTQSELVNACKINSAYPGNEFPFLIYCSEIVDCSDIEVKEQLTVWLRNFSSVKISDELSSVDQKDQFIESRFGVWRVQFGYCWYR